MLFVLFISVQSCCTYKIVKEIYCKIVHRERKIPFWELYFCILMTQLYNNWYIYIYIISESWVYIYIDPKVGFLCWWIVVLVICDCYCVSGQLPTLHFWVFASCTSWWCCWHSANWRWSCTLQAQQKGACYVGKITVWKFWYGCRIRLIAVW